MYQQLSDIASPAKPVPWFVFAFGIAALLFLSGGGPKRARA